ncbi:Phosphotransferase enzyme family protein [Aspergillus sclerotialis]|uniref:Altered inheritance of mitochondria protein 9, mitochondrial n=1 Tax=Aspergillus sclerotialis TaxID=2070753 RepID=A0A3A2ZSJ3_9EURO|nr:Phosphotransferase enzyme family protein [Aspergillus sclerotialis]
MEFTVKYGAWKRQWLNANEMTASEVATMDFARKILDTPAPRVHSWNFHAKSHPVGAEFIIMDKAEGVPLSQVWDTMELPEKLKVIVALTSLQKRWSSVSFSHYGSLYYAGDVQSPTGSHYIKDAKLSKVLSLSLAKLRAGIGASLTQYLQAIGSREMKAIQSIEPPKQIALFCGPNLYRPSTEKKLTALAWYQQIVNSLIPTDAAITKPCLWHNDLHDKNIFVDPHNPEKITGIIDCHNPDPALLDWDGLEPETLDLAPRPKLSGLFAEERATAMREYTVQTGVPFPFNFSEEEIERIKLDSDGAVAGTELVAKVKEDMGELWPDKGFIEHERYDDCKAFLDEVKRQILEQLAETEEEKAEYERYWPFE